MNDDKDMDKQGAQASGKQEQTAPPTAEKAAPGAQNAYYWPQPWGGYYAYGPYGPYYYIPPQPQKPQAAPEGKKKKTGTVLGIVAGMVLCAFLGAFLSVSLIYPLLQQYDGFEEYWPEESQPGGQTDETGGSTAKEDQYTPEEEVTEIGGEAPVIANATNPVPEIAAALENSVVGVNAKALYEGELTTYSRGTGFVIHTDGYILTNYHVIEEGTSYSVTLQDGTEYDALYVGGDASLDIVVLKIDVAGLQAVAIGDSSATRVGELAIAMGNPSGAGENLVGTVTVGYVSAVDRELVFNGTTQTFIQTDAALNPGNSGGPLVNDKGEVIGVVTLKSLISSVDSSGAAINAEGIGFAIPINIAAETALDIINNGSVRRPGIGIQYQSITAEQAAQQSIPVGKRVYSFMENSPAKSAGLEVGDVIIKCDGQEIGESDLLVETIQNSAVGDEVVLTVWRNGAEIDYTVVIGDLNHMLE